jgi:chemotaxis protein methyltransferase CheR
MNDQQFRQLLNRYQFSWEGYRKVRKGVKKRVHRYMKSLRYHTITDFLAELEKNDDVRGHCERLMTVSISRFFRDRALWQGLKEQILPEFMNIGRKTVRIWSAGCACGEEVYSFKIIWDCMSNTYLHVPDLEVFATDINPVYLDRACTGIYSSSSLKEVTKEIYSKYFEQKGGQKLFGVKSSLKKGITWKNHHLLSGPPDSDFDIIFLRNNVLTYYEDPLRTRAFSCALRSLASNGILVIGCHEKIPFETSDLIGVEPYAYVFRKRGENNIV